MSSLNSKYIMSIIAFIMSVYPQWLAMVNFVQSISKCPNVMSHLRRNRCIKKYNFHHGRHVYVHACTCMTTHILQVRMAPLDFIISSGYTQLQVLCIMYIAGSHGLHARAVWK